MTKLPVGQLIAKLLLGSQQETQEAAARASQQETQETAAQAKKRPTPTAEVKAKGKAPAPTVLAKDPQQPAYAPPKHLLNVNVAQPLAAEPNTTKTRLRPIL